MKWSVATGALITELISTWARKAQANGLSIIPIPGDPFALPSQNSDPIRGPIYVDLNTDCLKVTIVENLVSNVTEEYFNQVRRNNLFQEFEKESWDQRLFLFRESIVKRSVFGII